MDKFLVGQRPPGQLPPRKSTHLDRFLGDNFPPDKFLARLITPTLRTLQLTYTPQMLAVYIQYKYIYITKCQLNLLIGIGYILPTFGEDAQGRGMYIFNI